MNILNHPSIKVKWEFKQKDNDFLDMTMYKDPESEETGKLGFLQDHIHALLHKRSNHDQHVFRGIVKAESGKEEESGDKIA